MSLFQRLLGAYQLVRSQYRELKADLKLMKKYWRGPAVLCVACFIAGWLL